jgi:hypothetical protein
MASGSTGMAMNRRTGGGAGQVQVGVGRASQRCSWASEQRWRLITGRRGGGVGWAET